jgi:hypothetical protein
MVLLFKIIISPSYSHLHPNIEITTHEDIFRKRKIEDLKKKLPFSSNY